MIREIPRENNDEVINDVLHVHDGIYHGQRTPLHIDFPSVPPYAKPTKLDDVAIRETPLVLNAIGSKSRYSSFERHYPVLDIDGGIVNIDRPGAGFVVKCSGYGTYSADSVLVDIFNDHKLGGVEVFELFKDKDLINKSPPGMYVRELRIRPSDERIFTFARSTSQRGAHLLISRSMERSDHDQFLNELALVGAISNDWMEMSREIGMGVVRTPWTAKQPTHISSYSNMGSLPRRNTPQEVLL